MTAETPQPAASPQAAAAETPAPDAQDGAAGQSTGNQQLRIAILVVVAAVVGVGLWLAFGHSSKATTTTSNGGNNAGSVVQGIPAVSQTESQLMARALAVGQPFYWSGPKKGYHYEFSRLTNGNVYVRYLPNGVAAGAKQGQLLIIATYPFDHAYTRLKAGAHGRGVAGPHGSFVWVLPNKPQSVYVAWPHVPYEVEVYDPNPRKSARIAESGDVTTVG